MTIFGRLFGGKREPEELPTVYETPWDAIEGFAQDPRWGVEVLERREGWMRLKYDGVIGEAFDDPEDEWLHLRFRVPFTAEQKTDELAKYEWWSNYCARHTLFRWDIDEENEEYYGDAFALFEYQHDSTECIRAALNYAHTLNANKAKISVSDKSGFYVQAKREPAVFFALWRWMESPLAPPGTTIEHSGYREHSYWMGSTIGSVIWEHFTHHAHLRFTARDFQKYMHESDERRLMLYKLHLNIQRRHPRIRNFVALTPDPITSGSQETSIAILASSGTEMAPIFERCVKDVYNALIDYTEWFHFDFTPETDPWFDHSVKKPQTGYQRTPKPEGPSS